MVIAIEERICTVCGNPEHIHGYNNECITNEGSIIGNVFTPILQIEDLYFEITKLLNTKATYLELLELQKL